MYVEIRINKSKYLFILKADYCSKFYTLGVVDWRTMVFVLSDVRQMIQFHCLYCKLLKNRFIIGSLIRHYARLSTAVIHSLRLLRIWKRSEVCRSTCSEHFGATYKLRLMIMRTRLFTFSCSRSSVCCKKVSHMLIEHPFFPHSSTILSYAFP